MKKMLFTLTVAAAAFCALTFTACEKKAETPGEKLDKAVEDSNKAAGNFTKKAEDAAKETNEKVGDAINDAFKK